MKKEDLKAFERLMEEFNCRWVNTGRTSEDWKAKIFERITDGKQIAIYDRKSGFLVRMEEFAQIQSHFPIKDRCPKGGVFNKSGSNFQKERGVCTHVENVVELRKLLNFYFGKEQLSEQVPEAAKNASNMGTESSQRDPVEERRERLKNAPRIPKTREVVVIEFVRNPDVVEERLFLANGICEECRSNAPFLRSSNGEPYLEVHHVKPLSEGGEDVVENTLALCPNCHRKRHYG